ncbi:TPA: TldD/PmbA family protein [Candidatus Poribacteria bacterium]|nr:TldD/PmbA family protein [Candidatus Poribacteria bacterium]
MKEFTDLALDTAKMHGATYADIRIIYTKIETVSVKNGRISDLGRHDDLGFGIRVIADGAWGFSSSGTLSREEVQRMAAEAVRIAKASATTKIKEITLAYEPPHVDVWRTPIKKDPFKVPIEQKVDLLMRINEAAMKVKGISVVEAMMDFAREHQFFASTEGSFIEQEIYFAGTGYHVIAVGNGDMQRRSYPASFRGQYMTKGYELVEELPLLENVERIADEAVMLLTARKCPEMVTDLILDGSQLALQIHESIGHPSELDRVLGTEANYAGTSFLTLDKLGKLQYGSPIVNVVADSTIPNGLATVGYDDEGVEAQRWYLIRDGIFVGYLTSRETAPAIGEERSRGCMRADGWSRIPLIRMTNISLMPGECTLDELINDTKDGVYMETNKSWSIDQRRINFQFATELGWRIKNGRKVEPLKNPSYQGITVDFWNSCDAICNEDHFVLWGINNCGKGQPGQRAQMSHGAAPARFRKVKVGVA